MIPDEGVWKVWRMPVGLLHYWKMENCMGVHYQLRVMGAIVTTGIVKDRELISLVTKEGWLRQGHASQLIYLLDQENLIDSISTSRTPDGIALTQVLRR